MRSHPAWVCGLKLFLSLKLLLVIMSHPAWVCGLKRSFICKTQSVDKSHTLRGCVDWNHRTVHLEKIYHVTPCVGVWIETCLVIKGHHSCMVTPCVGVWIETSGMTVLRLAAWRHTLRGCVDWNCLIFAHIELILSHTLRGCVDWNPHVPVFRTIEQSHPAWVCGLKQLT